MASSLSPQRRGRMTPEVVICVSSKRYKSAVASPAARAKKVQVEDAAAASFSGLSRIEQIRLQARRKAELEDKEREDKENSKLKAGRNSGFNFSSNDDDVGQEEEEEDSDDDLPELASIKAPSSLSSALSLSNRSVRSSYNSHDSQFGEPSRSLTTSTDEVSSSFSLSRSQKNQIESSSSGTTMQRGRRSTARLEPYIFRPSLDPISDRRKKLQGAKESAAVQAKLVKREDFKHITRSDAIEKVLREHKREQRKGLDVNGLYNTIEMVRGINQMLEEDEDESGKQGKDRVQEGSSSESDLETSSASSLPTSPLLSAKGAQRVRFDSLLSEDEIQKERLSFVALTGDEKDGTEGQEAFDILLKDKEDAKRGRQVGEIEDRGLKERKFWGVGKLISDKTTFPDFKSDVVIYKVLRNASTSNNNSMISHFLRSGALTEELGNDDKNVNNISIWLFEVAILTATSDLSFAALQVIGDLLAHQKNYTAAKVIIDRLPTLLLKLGARREIINECFPAANVEVSPKQKNSKTNGKVGHIRRGERKRAIKRLVQILDLVSRTLNQKASQDKTEDRLNLFIAVLRLGVDPQLSGLEAQFGRLLEILLEASLESGPEMDSMVLSRLISTLIGPMAPTAQQAIFNIMPNTSIRGRLLQRCLAHRILIFSTMNPAATHNYSSLASALSDKSANVNPILPTSGRDYRQIEANVQLLCYTFNDLALQLLHRKDEEDATPAKSTFSKVIENYLNFDTNGFLLSQNQEKNKKNQIDWKISKNQIEALHQIMESLQVLSNQIQDGKGAFLDRSKVKDQLQRLRLMLLYQLGAFGLTGNKASFDLQQGTLSKWLKP